MTRMGVLIAVACCFLAAPAFAQDLTYHGVPLRAALAAPAVVATPPPRPVVVASAEMTPDIISPAAQSQKKSFWKTPWPYAIAGCVVVVAVVVAKKGSGGGY